MFRYSSRFGFVTHAAFALCLFLLAHASQAYQRVVVEPKFAFRNGYLDPVPPFRDTVEQAFADVQAAMACNSTVCITLSNLRPQVAGQPFDFNFNGVPYSYIYDKTICSGGSCNTYEGQGGITLEMFCPIGFGGETSGGYSINRTISCVKYFPDATPPPCEKSCIGNPILAATGEKLQVESDYASPTGLAFVRTYRSGSGMFSSSTTSAFMDYSAPTPQFSAACLPASYVEGTSTKQYCFRYMSTGDPAFDLFNADGRRVRFSGSSSAVTSNADIIDRVQLVTAGAGTEWKVTRPDDAVEFYSSTGLLLRRVLRNGQTFTNVYSDASTPTSIAPKPGLLISQTGPFGHVLHWTYAASGHLSQMVDPAGSAYSYSYDTAGNMSAVTFPDGKTRSYIYNESANTSGTDLPTALTGITDEQAARFATYKYNYSGLAISTEHAGGVEKFEITGLSPESYAAVTDPLGAQKTYTFQTILSYVRDKTLTQPSAPGVGTVVETRDYDANGNLSSSTDFNGNVTNRVFDLVRNLETSRTEAVGTSRARTITTQWHGTYRLPTQIDEPGRRTTYTYDSSGNALTKTVLDSATSVSRTWTYMYNTFGQVLTVDGPRTDVSDLTTYTYYNCTTGYGCGQVNTITNALGQVTTYTSYNAHGQPLTITDPNGVVTTLTYDLRQRLTSRTVGTELTTFEYWPTGLLKKATLPDGSYLAYTYDAAHRLIGISDEQGNSIAYTLDAMGNRTAEQLYDPSSALTQTRTRVFNTLNRLQKEIGAAGSPSVTTEYGYDNNGNQTAVNAPLSRNTIQSYDELNRLQQVTDPLLGNTQYGYNALDQLISVTDPRGKVTSYTYNALGDLTQQVSPDTGTTLSTYDSAGNLKTKTDARNKTGTYSYDALNRVTQLTYPDQTIAYTYDQGSNQKGRLTGLSDNSGSTSWTYDAQGRVTSRQQTMSGISESAGYAYDLSGRLQSLTLPSGNVVTYGYTNGKITSLTLNGATTILNNVLYQPFGPTTGWSWGNSTLAVREYDTDGKVTDIDSAGLKSYFYDDAFRITSITDVNDPTLSQNYGYDLLDRLTGATGSSLNQSWTYDANGNRLTQGGAQASTYSISSTNNRIASISGSLTRSYTYDAAGNTTGDGSATYSYDDAGRMVSATKAGVTANYQLNGLGQRVKKTVGGIPTYFVYDEAGHLLGEYNSAGTLIQETIWFGDIPVAVLKPNGGGVTLYYVHTDHLNSPRRISRPSDNAIVWRWDSDPFGTTQANENPSGLGVFAFNLRFPGQYYDQETGTHYNYLRDAYDPATGRFTQSDPIGLSGGINTYGYVYANPLEFIDPLGLFGECTKLMCIPGFAKDRLTSSKLIDEGSWRLENVHVEPTAPRQWTPGRDRAPSNPLGSQTAICFFAKTRSYRDEYVRTREWKCLELCYDCGAQFRETSYTEYLGSYEKIRREREQMIQQIRHMIPLLRCMEILRGLH